MAIEKKSSNNTVVLPSLAKILRKHILSATTHAGSGHPTSALSAVEIMTTLFWGGFFSFDTLDINNPYNDRLIFSKGHAAPLLYALYAVTGAIPKEELSTLRKFGSRLEGHPTSQFPYTEAATGSLGQGLSIGIGMALNSKYIDKIPYRTYVLLGDSEMAEGSVWEAIQVASYYHLNNLIGMIDVNRLGQRGETMLGHDIKSYAERIASFGWKTIIVHDGHSFSELISSFEEAQKSFDRPVMIIAKTTKGKGISFLEDQPNWHGKVLSTEEYHNALSEIGTIDDSFIQALPQHPFQSREKTAAQPSIPLPLPQYDLTLPIATRKAYGNALVRIATHNPTIVVLDAETSNATYANTFQKIFPDRFFEMFIAEQNMIGVAIGLARRGKLPFVSTFAAFLTRALDQIRMSQYSNANIVFVGSHSGVSIGEDGISQMGLMDIAMFRAIINSVVLYPSDAIATEKLVEETTRHHGISYIRTTRMDTPILYDPKETFPIGKCKVIRYSTHDRATIVAAGITLHEALAAYESLKQENIFVRIIDLYSIKPIDIETLKIAADETKTIITVEDHYAEGGIGEAVMRALSQSTVPIKSLAVKKLPHSGKPQELLEYEEIDRHAIIASVKTQLYKQS
ncbi:MAG: transketolase [bacterium]